MKKTDGEVCATFADGGVGEWGVGPSVGACAYEESTRSIGFFFLRASEKMLASTAYVPWRPTNYEPASYKPHPTDVCEPINLAATGQPPIVYASSHSGRGLSTLQLETIARIMQSFAKRSAFLLGDATGVGKGRTIAGLISELVAAQRGAAGVTRVIWVSASIRLHSDALGEYAETKDENDPPFEDVVCFASYSSMNPSRQTELREWLGESTYPVLILDECHALRNHNAINSQTMDLFIRQASNERDLKVLYSSATACSIPKHMAYLGRLGIFGQGTPFPTFDSFSKVLRQHGASLMELLAIDLRSRGAYVARQLSFSNICVSHRMMGLNAAERQVYDACGVAFRQADMARGSSHQSFFQRLITGFKVREAIAVIEEHVQNGSSVVVSLVNTGEAAMKRRENSVAGAHGTAQCVGEDALVRAEAEHIEGLPQNPIDALIDHFGVENVAELTGRQLRFVQQATGHRVCERNPPLRKQVDEFQSGRKHIAVLSRAGGVGISLHDAIDGRPRTHVILELPWSAEDLLQQMGRTHRSSSRSPPSYVLITTDIPAEQRFASAIVSKLQSFGALVKADRSSCTFSFLKVPRWSIAERRSIALYLNTASALFQHERDLLPTISRAQALAACQCQRQHSDTAIKTRMIDMLRNCQELGDRRLTVVAAAKKLYPNDIVMLMHKWTPDVHSMFPAPFKRQVMTLLLCAQAWETQNTIGALSKDLIFYIIEHVACPVEMDAAKTAARRFKQHGMDDVTTLNMDMILNRMLGMELKVQRDIFKIADALVHPKIPPPNACLVKYADDRAGAAIKSSISAIHHATFGSGVTGVCVDIVYSVRRPREPGPNSKFWRHAISNRTCWLDVASSAMLFSDCTEMQVPSCDAHVLRMRDYFPCERADWNQQVARHEQAAARRSVKLPTRFHLATVNAMALWEESTHRILRVSHTPSFPQGIVGLLVLIA